MLMCYWDAIYKSIRMISDYIYGIWQFTALSMKMQFEKEGGSTWLMHKNMDNMRNQQNSRLHYNNLHSNCHLKSQA